jgi:hypothetical protein
MGVRKERIGAQAFDVGMNVAPARGDPQTVAEPDSEGKLAIMSAAQNVPDSSQLEVLCWQR